MTDDNSSTDFFSLISCLASMSTPNYWHTALVYQLGLIAENNTTTKKALSILSEKGLIAGDWVLKNCGSGWRGRIPEATFTVEFENSDLRIRKLEATSHWHCNFPLTTTHLPWGWAGDTTKTTGQCDLHHPSTCQERAESGSTEFSSWLTQCLKCIQVFNKSWLKWVN